MTPSRRSGRTGGSRALEKLSPGGPTSAQVDAVEEATRKLQDEVDDAMELLQKDPDFGLWAKSQRGKADKALETVKFARKKVKFLEGPVVARDEAQKLWREAKRRRDPVDRGDLAEEA